MESLNKQPKLRKMAMRYGAWSVRSLYGTGSLMTFVKLLSKYKLDLVGAHRSDGTDIAPNQQVNI
jgi:hypothetical protein